MKSKKGVWLARSEINTIFAFIYEKYLTGHYRLSVFAALSQFQEHLTIDGFNIHQSLFRWKQKIKKAHYTYFF